MVWSWPFPSVAPSYGESEPARSTGKLPLNGGRVAHRAAQLEAAIGSAGTGRAPVAPLSVLRISMLLPRDFEVVRYGGQPGSRVRAKSVQWRAIRRASTALAGGMDAALVVARVLKTYGTSKLWQAF